MCHVIALVFSKKIFIIICVILCRVLATSLDVSAGRFTGGRAPRMKSRYVERYQAFHLIFRNSSTLTNFQINILGLVSSVMMMHID